jgi:MoaA/NifB/PqqE/SkfB family radical SAM enzyme
MLPSIEQCVQNISDQFEVLDKICCDYDDIESAKLDLYARLKKVWQERFEPDQRIVLVLTKDFYSEHAPAGALLQAVQVIVQDIDISNFFVCIVSCNPDLDTEYQYVHKTTSWDDIKFNCYTCSGTFIKLTHNHKPMDGKILSLKHLVESIAQLSDRHKKLLFQDPVFCMMPWVGINIAANNHARPCCEYQGPDIGDPANQSIQDIWNGDEIQQIRKNMLNSTPVPGCKNCYHKENLQRDSLRNSINRDFAHRIDLIDGPGPDGTRDVNSIRYWDIRYNNLCNFACRSCGPHSSSSWVSVWNALHPDQKRTQFLLQAGSNSNDIFSQMVQHLHAVEKIYFAGGEPLMIENFYRVLEMLDQAGRHDVHLCYNTNLSRLHLQERSILDLWSKFTKVSVGASLDAMGNRAEYLRTGTIWPDIVSNRRLILEHCPHVDFYVSATTGLINALHVPDFHQAWVEQGLIGADDFNVQLLLQPEWMSVANAPRRLKQKIVDRYDRHIDWLRNKDRTGRAVSGFRSVINLCDEAGHYDADEFWHQVRRLDSYHGTDLLSTFTELVDADL